MKTRKQMDAKAEKFMNELKNKAFDQHTPTPWYYKHGRFTPEECSPFDAYRISVDEGKNKIMLAIVPESEANAAFIVRAVNAHEEFREIVMALGHWMMGGYAPRADTLWDDGSTWKEKVLQAIAKAEGKQI